jgi:hypothetical protein
MSAVAIILAGLEGCRRKYLERLASLETSINTDHAHGYYWAEGWKKRLVLVDITTVLVDDVLILMWIWLA